LAWLPSTTNEKGQSLERAGSAESRIPETLRLFLQMCVRRLAHACCALFWQSAPSLGRNQVVGLRLPGRRHVQFQGRAFPILNPAKYSPVMVSEFAATRPELRIVSADSGVNPRRLPRNFSLECGLQYSFGGAQLELHLWRLPVWPSESLLPHTCECLSVSQNAPPVLLLVRFRFL